MALALCFMDQKMPVYICVENRIVDLIRLFNERRELAFGARVVKRNVRLNLP